MKILFIDFTLPYLLKDAKHPIGGWAVQLNAWISGLCANGHRAGVLTWKGANSFINRRLDFDLIETYNPDKGVKIVKYFYGYIPALYKKTIQYKPDCIIQACAGLNTGIMAYISKRLNIPFFYRCTSDIDADDRYKRKLLKYEQIAYQYGIKQARAIICQNKYQYLHFKHRYPKIESYILPNPFYKIPELPTVPFFDRTYIAWLGVFRKEKNLPLLYEIARKCPEMVFKITGTPEKNLDGNTKKALIGLGELTNVEFTGYLPRRDIPQFLSKAIALLNTSHYEGFSNTFLEAFAVGTPVIALEKVDPNLIIAKNKLGFSVKDESDFSKIIKNLTNNKQQYDAISSKGKEYVRINHDPAILAKKLIEILTSF